ncbi:MAG: glycine cleavage system aminomethyltransferase GcvT [Dehalococcoidia bacterium]
MAERTALFAYHQAAGARFVEFNGWDMPVHYEGILAEHRAVRANAGVFDTSHMGQVRISGADAGAWLDWLLPNDLAGLTTGRARYSPLLADDGGIVDDLMIYRLDEDDYLVVVNAGGRETDLAWFRERQKPGVAIDPLYDGRAMIAVQGPEAIATLARLSPDPIAALPRFGIAPATISGRPVLVARTGYTGEDGGELFLDADDAATVWTSLIEAGVTPCGLGARDTLRLEAALPLYGNDIDRTTNPFEAGLGWTVKLTKGDFVGRQALVPVAQSGPARALCGFRMDDRGIARHGYPVQIAGQVTGEVTSGSYTPTVDAAIGLAYLPSGAAIGTPIAVVIRDRPLAAHVVARPFYRRER